MIKVGDLVRHEPSGFIGIIVCIDPENTGCTQEVKVAWNDGDVCNMTVYNLEVIG